MIASLPVEVIEKKIMLIRGQKVMLDRDLAELYGVGSESAQPGCEAKCREIPCRFYVSVIKS